MTKAKKVLRLQRRSPRRRNAIATVEAIFEATARILRREGLSALNTNRIAETAGVGIATLYGYFANKEAILLTMAQRELDALRDLAIAGMRAEGVPPLRGVIRALIAGYSEGGPVRRILMETMIATGRSAELARPVQQAAEIISGDIGAFLPPGAAPPTEIGMYVITRAVDSVIRAAVYESVDFVREERFERQMVMFVESYLANPLATAGAK